jgi:hypothetical protein
MKKIVIAVAAAAGMTLMSCGSEKASTPQADSVKTVATQGPQPADNELSRDYRSTIEGHNYVISIHRTPDSSLPTVKDELDQEFYDNRVVVTITRDGDSIFHQALTKEDFLDYLSADERRGSILLGMVYDEEKSSRLHHCLAAQVGQPGTGEGPAFTIEIPLAGGSTFSIVRDSQQDTNNSQETDN